MARREGVDNRVYWETVEKMVWMAARHAGLCWDDAEDCVVEFEVMLLERGVAPSDLTLPGALDMLRQQIKWHVKTCVHRVVLARRYIVYFGQLDGCGCSYEPVSPNPGPEELAVARAEATLALKILGSLPPRQRWLWRRVEEDGERVVDLATEAGSRVNTLHAEISRIRRKLRAGLGD